MIMKGNPPLFSFDMNEGNQRDSRDKLELRLGPPTKEEDPISCGFQHPNSSVKVEMQFAGRKDPISIPLSSPTTCSQKRIAPSPSVIGWPPIRSFRKKITATTSSSKLCPDLTNTKQEEATELETAKTTTKTKDLFVKINMDGVPIGRKVNLRAHDNYGSLSSAVDQLFRGLLAARRDASFGSRSEIIDDTKEISGLLDGNGEYTLVYEDHEGDRVLVGDVPWNMFISTVKRLRVLKRSDISNE